MKKKVISAILIALVLTSCAAIGEEKPYSSLTAKHLTIWTVADPLYYVMALADAFAFLSSKTGYQRGFSKCYKKYSTNRGKLLTVFQSYIKTPKAHDSTYAGPPPETLPAAEAFDKLISLYCKDERTGAPATSKENPHSFATGKDYIIWNANEQVYYVMGLADAFAYLARKTGFLEGISKCYRQDRVNSAHLMIHFEGYIEDYKFFYKDYSGPDPKTLPAAEAFLQFNKLLCEGFVKE